MNENKLREKIEYQTEIIINILNKYDINGILKVDTEYNNDMVMTQFENQKINPVAVKNAKKDLEEMIDEIGKIRKLAYKVADFDYQDAVQKEMDDLEEIRQMIYKSFTEINQEAYVKNMKLLTGTLTITKGEAVNVLNWT